MDPWGSVWHSTILAKANENRAEHGADAPPDYTHAYLPHRSREAPIAVMEIVAHRMRQAGISFVRNQYDGKNVFPSVGRKTLLSQIPQMKRREEDEIVATHRIVFACMRIVCYNGEATFLLRQGVLPGDTHAVECFKRSFSNVMVQWETDRLRHSAHAK